MGLFIFPQSVGALRLPQPWRNLDGRSRVYLPVSCSPVSSSPWRVFSTSRLCCATNIQPPSALPHNVRSESPRNNSDPSSKETSRRARVDQSTPRAAINRPPAGVTSTITRCVVAESLGFRTNSTCVCLSATWRALQLTIWLGCVSRRISPSNVPRRWTAADHVGQGEPQPGADFGNEGGAENISEGNRPEKRQFGPLGFSGDVEPPSSRSVEAPSTEQLD